MITEASLAVECSLALMTSEYFTGLQVDFSDVPAAVARHRKGLAANFTLNLIVTDFVEQIH